MLSCSASSRSSQAARSGPCIGLHSAAPASTAIVRKYAACRPRRLLLRRPQARRARTRAPSRASCTGARRRPLVLLEEASSTSSWSAGAGITHRGGGGPVHPPAKTPRARRAPGRAGRAARSSSRWWPATSAAARDVARPAREHLGFRPRRATSSRAERKRTWAAASSTASGSPSSASADRAYGMRILVSRSRGRQLPPERRTARPTRSRQCLGLAGGR